MKFYLDEDMSQRVAERLRRRGIPAVSSHESNNDGLIDEEQLAYAAEHGYVLATYNRIDFLAVASAWFATGREFPGIVLLLPKRYPRHNFQAQIEGLARLASGHGGLAVNTVVYLP